MPAPAELSATSAVPAPARRRTLIDWARDGLPQGQTLPEESWKHRHHALLALLWLHVVALPIFGVIEGYDLAHSVGHTVALTALAVLATLAKNRRAAAALVSLGLITSSALLVHIWGGVIEGHFHFFVMIAVLALYEDWLPFLLAAAYVVIHHGVTGALDPGAVYNHPAAVAHPWKWALIHGAFVTAAGVASVVMWHLNEGVRAETTRAYELARESEEQFKTAFEGAPIGMVLTSIEPGNEGCFMQVNHAFCDFTGYPEEDLVGRHFREFTYAEDVDSNSDLFSQLLAGDIPRYQVEKRYVRADGELLWGLLTVSLVHDSFGAPAYAIAQVQDVTERKRSREELAYQALHDSLTGLANRRSLLADLEGLIPEASRENPALLLLFDLDGFKAYNDTFGHPAGDVLLTRLGHNLAAAVEGLGSAYRMGGDEFCVLVPLNGQSTAAVGEAAATALSEHGEGFTITASWGWVLLPAEARTSAAALRLADQRMYARKSVGSRASAGRQSTDVLLRVLSERDPELGTHLDEVTELCKAVARRLGLPDDQMTPLLQAASLHDVGKAAVPDEILSKPAALDDEEWEFMRRHPVIGERILSAAPALTNVARLVRHSHERFDGQGYPDGLTGDDVPLGARIIAVCDAYDAMTSNRPYRTAMSREGALTELRRCAGDQFDPLVVEAFVAAIINQDAPVANLSERA